jgi:hypothetical protein
LFGQPKYSDSFGFISTTLLSWIHVIWAPCTVKQQYKLLTKKITQWCLMLDVAYMTGLTVTSWK